MLKKIVFPLILFPFVLIGAITFLLALNSLTSTPDTPGNSFRKTISYSNPDYSINYKKIEEEFGRDKIFSRNFKNEELIALSHYPELKEAKIEFLEQSARFPLQSRPKVGSLLLPFKKRDYVIVISNKSLEEYDLILLNKIPREGQIGVLGHELAHLSYYEKRNSLEITVIGIKYVLSKRFRNTFERMTDRIAIQHHLGNQLLDWRNYYEGLKKRRALGEISNKMYFEERYLTAEEIKKEIEEQKEEAE
jgi:hypothetical protein